MRRSYIIHRSSTGNELNRFRIPANWQYLSKKYCMGSYIVNSDILNHDLSHRSTGTHLPLIRVCKLFPQIRLNGWRIMPGNSNPLSEMTLKNLISWLKSVV